METVGDTIQFPSEEGRLTKGSFDEPAALLAMGSMRSKTTNMRRETLKTNSVSSAPVIGEMDVAALATVAVTSEAAGHPVENAFDGRRGPGGTRWVADTPGEQTLLLAFDAPQHIEQVALEVEENHDSRTQELTLAVSQDGGRTYRELLRQEFNFSPPGTTFECETWTTAVGEVTHLRLRITPDKGSRPCRASLTALSLR